LPPKSCNLKIKKNKKIMILNILVSSIILSLI